MLTAIVDGEADADAVLQARAHLRHCTPCRATLRHLRMADRSLAVLLPVGGGAPAATGLDLDMDLPDGPGGLLGRLADALSSFLHERAAAAAVRLQSTIDLAANHKVAAVAASAAAMAGGGVAVEQAHPDLGQARPALHARDASPARTAALRPSNIVVRRVTDRSRRAPRRVDPVADRGTAGPIRDRAERGDAGRRPGHRAARRPGRVAGPAHPRPHGHHRADPDRRAARVAAHPHFHRQRSRPERRVRVRGPLTNEGEPCSAPDARSSRASSSSSRSC